MGNAGGLVAITASFEKKQIPTPPPNFLPSLWSVMLETSWKPKRLLDCSSRQTFCLVLKEIKAGRVLVLRRRWSERCWLDWGDFMPQFGSRCSSSAAPSFWWPVSVSGDGTEGEATCWSQPWDFYEALGQNARFWKVFNQQWKICKSVVILLVRISFPACIHGWAGSGLCWLFRPWKEGGCGLVGGLLRPVRYRWKHGL